MKLHGMLFSPFVQRVLITTRIKGIALNVAPPSGSALPPPEFAAISPMQWLPVLEEDDGWTLYESSAIIAYLEETQPGPSLLPVDSRDAARARLIAGLVDTEIAAGLRHYVIQKLFGMYDKPDALEYGFRQTEQGFDAIERIGLGTDWAVGDRPTVADAALIPLLTLSELIASVAEPAPTIEGHKSIETYWARIKETPLGSQSYREMRDGFTAAPQDRKAAA